MLTDQKVKALKPKEKQYKVSDEKGLYLLVKPNAGKYWRLKYRFAGKEKNLALGVYPDVSLKQARLARDEEKKLIQSNIDPVQDKQEKKLKRLELSNNSYEVVAREWIDKKRTQWSKVHSDKVLRSFEQDIFPPLSIHALLALQFYSKKSEYTMFLFLLHFYLFQQGSQSFQAPPLRMLYQHWLD